MHSIFNDVAEVVPITTVFPRCVVLSDAPSCIVLNQMAIWTG
jgi:hypothetical protein